MATLHDRKPSSDGSDIAQTNTQRTSNLARIRDNQRRSRARRKEYLQDLETKYRSCEQLGVEASAEIQAAARRVVDENRRLRALLKQQGLTDAQLDTLTIGSAANPQLTQSARELESLLTTKKVCRPGSGCGPGEACSPSTSASLASPSITTKQEDVGARESPKVPLLAASSRAVSSVPTVQQQQQSLSPTNQQFPPYAYYDAPQSHMPSPVSASVPWQQQQQRQQQHMQPHISQQQQPQQQSYGYTDESHLPNFLVGQDIQEWNNNDFESTNYADPASAVSEQPSLSDQHSCRVAAETLRSFNPTLGAEVEAELGCRGASDCVVSTHQVFDILSRMQSLDSA